MKLEPIDTSTTEGKIEVMRLASEGRRLAYCHSLSNGWKVHTCPEICSWDWDGNRFAIIAEPVGPKEAWMVIDRGGNGRYIVCEDKRVADKYYSDMYPIVRYVRADD